MPYDSALQAFVERKTRIAERAIIQPLRTVDDRSEAWRTRGIGNAWTRQHYDGDFHLLDAPAGLPAVSLVFVQSRDGNTGARNPEDLGGGATDTQLIYEGLSRVAADAVLAGAASVGANVLFSVWHPEMVSLRQDLRLARHPAQIVISNHGHIDLSALLFNVPDVPVFVIAGARCQSRCAAGFSARPWITVVPLPANGLIAAFSRLRIDHGLSRISAIGGRATASQLIDAGLVQDLCLTTTAHEGGEPNTPFYTGNHPPMREVIVKKQGMADTSPILFEHLALTLTDSSSSSSLQAPASI
jgi:riboflavin biosynthesis pyrimidine reductase